MRITKNNSCTLSDWFGHQLWFDFVWFTLLFHFLSTGLQVICEFLLYPGCLAEFKHGIAIVVGSFLSILLCSFDYSMYVNLASQTNSFGDILMMGISQWLPTYFSKKHTYETYKKSYSSLPKHTIHCFWWWSSPRWDSILYRLGWWFRSIKERAFVFVVLLLRFAQIQVVLYLQHCSSVVLSLALSRMTLQC